MFPELVHTPTMSASPCCSPTSPGLKCSMKKACGSTRLVYPLPLGIYVAKGNTELAEAIKATLATLKANGKYAALIKKYNLESID